jgi:hypothetical protein
VNRFLRRNDVVSAFRGNSRTPSRFHDRVVNDGVNSAREQNPFISCQILKHELFPFRGRVAFRKNRIERRQNEW